MMTDPIADMLTRIRNAASIENPSVKMPSSKLKKGIADVLKREGFIWDWEEIDGVPSSTLLIHLKYGANGEKVINSIKRISKSGRRVYCPVAELDSVLNGMGIRIVSTSHGILSDREARQKNVSGEVICQVY